MLHTHAAVDSGCSSLDRLLHTDAEPQGRLQWGASEGPPPSKFENERSDSFGKLLAAGCKLSHRMAALTTSRSLGARARPRGNKWSLVYCLSVNVPEALARGIVTVIQDGFISMPSMSDQKALVAFLDWKGPSLRKVHKHAEETCAQRSPSPGTGRMDVSELATVAAVQLPLHARAMENFIRENFEAGSHLGKRTSSLRSAVRRWTVTQTSLWRNWSAR